LHHEQKAAIKEHNLNKKQRPPNEKQGGVNGGQVLISLI